MPGAALYLPPVEGEILQGDIYERMPSSFIDSRPLRIARQFKTAKGKDGRAHDLWSIHTEDGPGPQGGFKWKMSEGGEAGLLVRAHLGMAMVLTHDCEIENDEDARTLAMIRPIDDLEEDQQERLFSGREEDVVYGRFALEAQQEEPAMSRCFVDFRRLTTVRPAVLAASTRKASLSEELRKAIAQQFRLYLFRRVEREGPND